MTKYDCYWYHCEHQMGASIDCCTLGTGLGDCPCSDNCHNYISHEEVTEWLKTREVKPIEIWHGHMFMYYQCPICTSKLNVVDRYCSHCGRKVKWDA